MFARDYLGMPWANWTFPLVAVYTGLLAAQVSALLIDVAFSADPWWRRIAVFAPLAIVYLAAALIGTALMLWCFDPSFPYLYESYYSMGVGFFLALPLVSLAGLAPLVTFRWVFGWALARTDASGKNEPHVHRPASLVSMLLLMGVMAAGFGLIRLAPIVMIDEPGLIWILTGVMSLVAGGFSLLGVIPVIVIGHYVRSRALQGVSLCGFLVLAIAASLGLEAVFTSWTEVLDNAALNIAMYGGMGAIYFAGFALYLGALRRWGWAVKPASRYQVT